LYCNAIIEEKLKSKLIMSTKKALYDKAWREKNREYYY
tara:strand:+ start:391 stop:504 length:114 start_codon:yes stop_codon:yes gene_type:complete